MKHFILVFMAFVMLGCPSENEAEVACESFSAAVCEKLDICEQHTSPQPMPCDDYFIGVCEITYERLGKTPTTGKDLDDCIHNLLEESLACPLDNQKLLNSCPVFLHKGAFK